MDYGKFRYLSLADLAQCGLYDWDQAMDVAEATYKEHSRGLYEMPPKPGVHPVTCPGAFLHAMPGYLKESNICGLKWVGVFGHNRPKYGIKALSSLMILNDVETGYPLAIMEAGIITAIRTATSSGVSVKYLARKDSKVVGLVGAGEQGENNMKLIKYLTYTDGDGITRDLALGSWNGRLVLIDDGMPVDAETGAYTTYVLGEGSVILDDIGDTVPYEMSRNPEKNGGQDTLYVRDRYICGVDGISFEKPASLTASASNADLENGANWKIINDGTTAIPHKAIAIAKIISKG